jgi:curved DNA-binding protein CbpA
MSFNFNLYEELEITKKATAEEIKKAYRKLAMVDLIYLII